MLPVLGIFNMRASIIIAMAHRGCTKFVRESALTVDSEKQPLLRWGVKAAYAAHRTQHSLELHPHPG